jgi:hypothetical protein
MNRTVSFVKFAAVLAAIATTISGSPAQAKNSPASERSALTITVKIYDYTRADRKSLLKAENQAAAIFASANVNVNWVDCPTSHAVASEYPNCTAVEEAQRYTLTLLPNKMVTSASKSQDSLGSVSDCSTGTCTASVYYERIAAAAGGNNAPAAVLVGRVMAREIGQLILGANSDSRSGILKAAWSTDDLGWDPSHTMAFTVEQTHRLKTRLAAEQPLEAQTRATAGLSGQE